MKLNNTLGRFRLVAILEGISYLLFAITMPLKYIFEITAPNYVVGMLHGILFILYVGFCLYVIFRFRWSFKTSFLALIASLIPFGTFYADQKLFLPIQQKQAQ
ncbi:MAG: DUF3817 domain-containing protein [Fulvivirga sp.]|nr:DUF3817 domain-containing protein [Fulvivirga sp.]